jgi:hypothetical protein
MPDPNHASLAGNSGFGPDSGSTLRRLGPIQLDDIPHDTDEAMAAASAMPQALCEGIGGGDDGRGTQDTLVDTVIDDTIVVDGNEHGCEAKAGGIEKSGEGNAASASGVAEELVGKSGGNGDDMAIDGIGGKDVVAEEPGGKDAGKGDDNMTGNTAIDGNVAADASGVDEEPGKGDGKQHKVDDTAIDGKGAADASGVADEPGGKGDGKQHNGDDNMTSTIAIDGKGVADASGVS